jgi:hypothetical protein
MRIVVQRVLRGGVSVGGQLVSSIGRGLVVLVGISTRDTPKDADQIARKILNLRVFEGEGNRMWDKNVAEKNYEILLGEEQTTTDKFRVFSFYFSFFFFFPFSEPVYTLWVAQRLKQSELLEKVALTILFLFLFFLAGNKPDFVKTPILFFFFFSSALISFALSVQLTAPRYEE